LDLPVKLYLTSGTVVAGRIANASLSGALVRTQTRVTAMSRLVVELDRSDRQHSGLHADRGDASAQLVSAYVVREATDSIGIEWAEFSPPAIAAILSSARARPHLHRLGADRAAQLGASLPIDLTHAFDQVLR
jgi:hypothetical protein